MSFDFTPEEVWQLVPGVEADLRKQGYEVKRETACEVDSPYRTTLLGSKKHAQLLIEVQRRFEYHREIRELAMWMAARSRYAELYIATIADANMPVGALRDMRVDGVGRLLVDGDKVVCHEKAANHALRVTYGPQLKFTGCEKEVAEALRKFNHGEQKDGLGEICELVEKESFKVALVGEKKGYLTADPPSINAMSWENIINVLESPRQYHPGKNILIEPELGRDLKSFKDARNLFKHKILTRAKALARETQAVDKMSQGGRLLSELIALRKRIK